MVDGTKGISALTGFDVYGDIKNRGIFWRGMFFVLHGLRPSLAEIHHYLDHWGSRGGGLVSRIRICTMVISGGRQTSSWLELRGRRRVKEKLIQKGGGKEI